MRTLHQLNEIDKKLGGNGDAKQTDEALGNIAENVGGGSGDEKKLYQHNITAAFMDDGTGAVGYISILSSDNTEVNNYTKFKALLSDGRNSMAGYVKIPETQYASGWQYLFVDYDKTNDEFKFYKYWDSVSMSANQSVSLAEYSASFLDTVIEIL